MNLQRGQLLVELLVVMALSAILFSALLTGWVSTRGGRAQGQQRVQAIGLLKETEEAVRSVRNNDWTTFATFSGTLHPVINGTKWTLTLGTASTSGLTQQVVISDVYRSSTGAIVTSGGTIDPSTRKVVSTVSWSQPNASSISSTFYVTRSDPNANKTDTISSDFSPGIFTQTQVATVSGGEVKLLSNKAKWCSPSFAKDANNNEVTIDLPDGPPVAVAATASASLATPNDVFAAVAPADATSTKLAYVTVSANTDPPVPTLKGTFTLDASKYSAGTYPSSLGGLTNSFKTNDVKYYKSPAGKIYALMATDLADHEVVVAQINDGSGNAYQDPVNKIYKYWTYFNTKIYSTAYSAPTANSAEVSGAGNNDGFETTPANAYINDGAVAVDKNSGNNTGTNCTGSDKDKHRFYNYNFSVPSGATINGIEIGLGAKADSVNNVPKVCVQLSWDGGTTWTTAQSTSTLTTSITTYTLGGSADTWGRAWTDTNFTNANFRVRVIDVSSSNSRDFSLDWLGAKIYYNGTVTVPNDQAPYGYGASAMKIFENKGYVLSGGFMYVFDLSNIDSKSPTNQLDQIGCRIQLQGSDCQPGNPNGAWKKYTNGQTDTNYGSVGSPSHNTCADGGNIALNADEAVDVARVSTDSNNLYAFVAIGGQAGDELDVIKMQTVPDAANIVKSTCGVTNGTDWKEVGHLDFNPNGSSEEAANSVYVKTDGTRVYMTSNGGADSKQFYIISTSTPSSPQFLTTAGGIPASGYYNSASPAPAGDTELYPKRSLTVLNGQRAILVGKDGIAGNGDAEEYQVLNMTSPNSESAPAYCGGLNYDTGFNDLTSISEADGDNFVYMVANTQSNELKIIQGGLDQEYLDSGTFESSPFDATNSAAFNRFVANISLPASTSISAQLAVIPAVSGSCPTASSSYTYIGPGGTSNASDVFSVKGASISAQIPFGNYLSSLYQNPERCFRYKMSLSTTNTSTTSALLDMTWNYSK